MAAARLFRRLRYVGGVLRRLTVMRRACIASAAGIASPAGAYTVSGSATNSGICSSVKLRARPSSPKRLFSGGEMQMLKMIKPTPKRPSAWPISPALIPSPPAGTGAAAQSGKIAWSASAKSRMQE